MTTDNKYQRIPMHKLSPFTYTTPTIPEEVTIDPFEKENCSQNLQLLSAKILLGLSVCLSYNAVAVTTVITITGIDTKSFFLSIAYLLCLSTVAYLSWYRSLSHALTTDSGPSFHRFFLFYYFHIGFCLFAAVAPPVLSPDGRSLTGLLSTIEVFCDEDSLVGYLYLIGFVVFVVESIFSIYLLHRVYAYCRRSGLELEMA